MFARRQIYVSLLLVRHTKLVHPIACITMLLGGQIWRTLAIALEMVRGKLGASLAGMAISCPIFITNRLYQ
jgi:hypothetical protein